MTMAGFAVVIGLALLVWSADRFVEGAAATARYCGMPPLLIGMVIVGFGTSAPEMAVSVLAAVQGNPGIALGNAFGSNITNIALILGLTAMISPIAVQSSVLRRELPALLGVTALVAWQLSDGRLSRADALSLLLVFGVLMAWTIREGSRHRSDALGEGIERQLENTGEPIRRSLFWLATGLVVLIISSRILVWGAVEIARHLGVGDLLIGLTVVAIGTSLPELVSSLIAAKKGEHDIALGNIIGSNFFNTLAVVGLAGAISPMQVEPEVLTRDILVMGGLTLTLFVWGYGFRGPGRINRLEGAALVTSFFAYTGFLISSMV